MTTPRPRRTFVRPRLVLLVGGAVVAVGALIGLAVTLWPLFSAAGAPGPGTTIVASAHSKASLAAAELPDGAERDAARFLAEQPTAYWLTPEADPLDSVAERIASLADEARAQSARLAVVVYGLPGRDCGSFSAGGLAPADYEEWTRAIGQALTDAADVEPIVILEPDSLALAPECGNVEERVAQLTDAVAALASESTWIYLDGGHSNWLPVSEMAALIRRVGHLDAVRGFTTNVSNFNATVDEIGYAHSLSARVGDLHALIDTSRNGAGSNGEWCNPDGRLTGEPGGTIGDDIVDTNLWIKPPGESDGTCNGGPAAGHWWPEGAVELTREASRG